jgi:menaquinone-9 beta-reductase
VNVGRGTDEAFDVVIVGARCAGAATAVRLARAGLDVLVVDKTAAGSDTLSTHALTRTAVLELSRLGVLDGVRAAGTPRVTSVSYHYGDDVVTIPFAPCGDVDGLYAPRRTVLDALLADAAVDAGAEVRHGTTLRQLLFSGDGQVRGTVVDDGHTRRRIRCRLVIGADGARSTVARAVDAPVLRTAAASTATIYTFVDGLAQDAYHNFFRPSAVAGWIPTNGGQANVWVSVEPERFASGRTDVRGLFGAALVEAAPELAAHVLDGRPLGQFRSFGGLAGFTRRAHGPGWALVGDACAFEDPASAHGITDALVGAELLARAVVDVADGADEHGTLAAYAARCAELAGPMMAGVEAVASFRCDMDSLRDAHRSISRAMRAEWDAVVALPPLRPVSTASQQRRSA